MQSHWSAGGNWECAEHLNASCIPSAVVFAEGSVFSFFFFLCPSV